MGQIRSLTRDAEKFPLVHAENRSYGFHRNLYGIRWHGRITASAVTFGVLGYMLWLANIEHQAALTPMNVLALLAAGFCLVTWCLLPSTARMESAAERYAYELLQAAVVLHADRTAVTSGDPS